MLKRRFLSFMARRWLLLSMTTFIVFLLYFLTCRPHNISNHHMLYKVPTDDTKYHALLQENDEQYHHYASSLMKQIFQLKKALQRRRGQLKNFLEQTSAMLPLELDELSLKTNAELELFLHRQLHRAEIHTGTKIPNEYSLVPFETFTLHRVYQLESGLARHPIQRVLGKYQSGALEAALHLLNGPLDRDDLQFRRIYSPRDFFEGLSRIEQDKGTLYDLTFRDNTSLDFRRLVFFQPFAPLLKVKDEVIDTSNTLINIIVPLDWMRLDSFRQFMHNFREVCIQLDKHSRIHLTVVFFGNEKMDEVRRNIDSTARGLKYRNFTLIHLHEKFSRGRGLEVGVRAWKKNNVLLFFCDVDIHFTSEFLHSCRVNAEPGKRVFYPIPFSLFNPNEVYREHIPPLEKQMVVNKSTGYWRDFGFGMTCQYRSDFINIGGFDSSIKIQGKEDLHLYRKYLHSNLMVVRVPSRGLFHVWHETNCADDLPADLFQMCIATKAMNEASYNQMGDLYFHQEIDSHRHKYKTLNHEVGKKVTRPTI